MIAMDFKELVQGVSYRLLPNASFAEQPDLPDYVLAWISTVSNPALPAESSEAIARAG